MTIEDICFAFQQDHIPYVLIGDDALTCYGAARSGTESDIAVKTVDLKGTIRCLYKHGLDMVTGTDNEDRPALAGTIVNALKVNETLDWGFLKFLSSDMELNVRYDLPLPFMRLYQDSRFVDLSGYPVTVASADHLRLIAQNDAANTPGSAQAEKAAAALSALRGLSR